MMNLPRSILLCSLLLGFLPKVSPAADLLDGDRLVLQQEIPNAALLESMPSSTTLPNDSVPIGTVKKVTIKHPTTLPWGIAVAQTIAADVPEDSRIHLQFQARSATGNPIRVVLERAGTPYSGIAELKLQLTDYWKAYETTVAAHGYGPSGLALRFQVGQQAGVVELASIHLEDIGPPPDADEVKAAIAPAAVARRIEKYRKGDLRVIVHDSAGRPAEGATVKIEQTRQAFRFGCNIFALQPGSTEPSQLAYQQRFAELFNYATLPFYWGTYEPQRGQTHEDALRAMAIWCQARGIEPKGHPLVWHEVYPPWAPRNADAAIPVLRERVTNAVGRLKDCVTVWDVVNEATSSAEFPNTGVGSWAKRDGAAAVVRSALGWARAAGNGSPETFVYNDDNTEQANLDLLTELQAAHELPDAIGIQSHMHTSNWSAGKIWRIVSAFSRFDRPIHFTETTVVSGEHRPFPSDPSKRAADWPSTPAGEAEQADYLVQFYLLLFSCPSVQAITYWDLSDQNAWLGAPGGLLRSDLSPKPAYDRLLKLIRQDWRTSITGRTGADGILSTRGFLGDYQIDVVGQSGDHGQSKATLGPDPAAKTVEIQLTK